jgi:hypothetical protein
MRCGCAVQGFDSTQVHLARVKKTVAAEAPVQIDVIVLLIILAFGIMVRLRLLDLPLERDEGEYAYAGSLLLDGVPPYAQAYNMKFPGMYAVYAIIIACLGHTTAGIRTGLLLANALTTLLLYFLVRRIFSRATALIAAAAYTLFALEPTLLGLYAHATHFVNLAVVAAFLLLTLERRSSAMAAGALLAIAILIKQQAAAFALFAVVWRPRRVLPLVTGAAIVGIITAALLYISGVFSRFWFWTVSYASQYVTSAAASQGWLILTTTAKAIFYFAPLLWLLAAAGLVIVFVTTHTRDQRNFVIGYTLAAIVAIAPGFYFREHYFIVLLPVASVLSGVAVVWSRRFGRFVPAAALAMAIITSLMRMWGTFFVLEPDRVSKFLFARNPFVEAVQVATYLRDHTTPSDRIAILGSEPEILFYAQRRSATGYIYMYPLMEHQRYAHQMQQEAITEIEKAKPTYLVTLTNSATWLRRDDSDRTIFSWLNETLQHGWVLEGIADIEPDETTYAWGADAQNYRPKSKDVIAIYRRADKALIRR